MDSSAQPGSSLRYRRLLDIAWWLVPCLFCVYLYWPGLKAWFQQDDFAWLNLRNQVHDARSLLHALFVPTSHGTFRPWSERGFFLLFRTLFGFNALPYRACAFVTQCASLVLLNSIVTRLSGSRIAGFFAPVLWAANPNLAFVMAWSSAYMEILCGFVLLLAFHFLLRYIETGAWRFYVVQWCVFLLGFGVMETNLMYPALAAAYTWLCARKHFRQTLPLFIPSAIYAALDMILMPKQTSGPYAMHLDVSVLTTLWTYWQWALQPLYLSAVTHLPGWVEIADTAMFTTCLIGFGLWSARRRNFLPAVFLVWFLLLALPVLPLRDHISSYYLFLPVIGLASAGAAALGASWKKPWLWRSIAIGLTGIYLAVTWPVARHNVRYWAHRSFRTESLVKGVVEAARIHPGNTILLVGVDSDQFWSAIWDAAFRAMSVSDVFLAPGSGNIQPLPPEGLSRFELDPALVASEWQHDTLVVYQAGGPRLKNITSRYAADVLPGLLAVSKAPRRIDVGSRIGERFLGSTWYPREGAYRWMPRTASVRLAGPQSVAAKLHLEGYCPRAQTDRGPLDVRVDADGVPLGNAQVSQGDAAFDLAFDFPPSLVGKPSIEVTVQLSRTFEIHGDPRSLGVAFGVFEIR